MAKETKLADVYRVSRKWAKKKGVPATKTLNGERYIYWSGGWPSRDIAEIAVNQANGYNWTARILIIRGEHYVYARYNRG